jgi:hypothetical protein
MHQPLVNGKIFWIVGNFSWYQSIQKKVRMHTTIQSKSSAYHKVASKLKSIAILQYTQDLEKTNAFAYQ